MIVVLPQLQVLLGSKHDTARLLCIVLSVRKEELHSRNFLGKS